MVDKLWESQPGCLTPDCGVSSLDRSVPKKKKKKPKGWSVSTGEVPIGGSQVLLIPGHICIRLALIAPSGLVVHWGQALLDRFPRDHVDTADWKRCQAEALGAMSSEPLRAG